MVRLCLTQVEEKEHRRNRKQDIQYATIQDSMEVAVPLPAEKNVPHTTCQSNVQQYLYMFPYHTEQLQALAQSMKEYPKKT